MEIGALDVKYSYAQTQLKGEDVTVVPYEKVTACYFGKCAIFAICDGHGGSQASVYFGKHLEEVLKKTLNCDLLESAILQGVENIAQMMRSCLHETFIQLDKDFSVEKNSSSGTTATVIVVYGRLVTIANVGDSKALLVLPTFGEEHELTEDHRINDNESERLRMIHNGAKIQKTKVGNQYFGVLRVQPAGLALSRSIGDRRSKPHVVPNPHITQILLPSNQKSRIVLASDGLWDDLTCQKVSMYTQECKKLQLLPQKLIKHAIYANDGSLGDDISVVAISLKPLKRNKRKIMRHINYITNVQMQYQRYGEHQQCIAKNNSLLQCGGFQNLSLKVAIPAISVDTLHFENKHYYDVLNKIQRCSGSSVSTQADFSSRDIVSPFYELKICPTKVIRKRVYAQLL